jgi:hypothetical protein
VKFVPKWIFMRNRAAQAAHLENGGDIAVGVIKTTSTSPRKVSLISLLAKTYDEPDDESDNSCPGMGPFL